jgi:hypothetical protein
VEPAAPDKAAEVPEVPVSREAESASGQLQDFVDLVNQFGPHLTADRIQAELDDADREKLMTTDLPGRQAWAEMLAHRLTQPEKGDFR